mmetsp:Transcript_117138/g.203946  ORF Transcript_117138/g.203946 Transcript_117138/m.203946 type:complete len:211 (+) Transcript_117138:895-1527(+)
MAVKELQVVVRPRPGVPNAAEHVRPHTAISNSKPFQERPDARCRPQEDLADQRRDVDPGVALPRDVPVVAGKAGEPLQPVVQEVGSVDRRPRVVVGPAGLPFARGPSWLAVGIAHRGRGVDDQQVGQPGPAIGVAEQCGDACPVVLWRLQGIGRQKEGPELHKQAEHGAGPGPAIGPHQDRVGPRVPLALHEEVVLMQRVPLGRPCIHES